MIEEVNSSLSDSPYSEELDTQIKQGLVRRVQLLAIIGALISLYLVYHHVALHSTSVSGPSFCSINATFDCDRVARSEFSEMLGIPVASFGLAYYFILIAVSSLFLAKGHRRHVSQISVLWALAVFGLGFTLYMVYLSAFVIKSFCLVCAVLYIDNLCSFIILALHPFLRNKWIESVFKGVGDAVSAVLLIGKPSNSRMVISGGVLAYCIVTFVMSLWIFPWSFSQAISSGLAGSTEVELQNPELLLSYNLWKASSVEDLLLAEDDFDLGSESAKVVIVEFSDFECPFCQRMGPFLKGIVSRYPEKVRLVFKNYPLDQSCNIKITRKMHELSCLAAAYARCAGEQGNFWSMNDEIIRYGRFTKAQLNRLPEMLELDLKEFELCLKNSQTMERIKKDIELANSLEVHSTPTVYVNGKKVLEPSRDKIEFIVKTLLSEQSEH